MSKIDFKKWVTDKILNNVEDVDIIAPSNNQVLTYFNGDWINKAPVAVDFNEASLSSIYTANETITKLQIVRVDDSTHISVANSNVTFNDFQITGIATESGVISNDINVLTSGVLEDVGLNFTMHASLFLDTDGSITETAPMTEPYLTKIGKSLGVGKILIEIVEPIELEV